MSRSDDDGDDDSATPNTRKSRNKPIVSSLLLLLLLLGIQTRPLSRLRPHHTFIISCLVLFYGIRVLATGCLCFFCARLRDVSLRQEGRNVVAVFVHHRREKVQEHSQRSAVRV